MKNLIYILITFFVFISCNAQQKITAKKDKNVYLVGIANKASLTNDSILIDGLKCDIKSMKQTL